MIIRLSGIIIFLGIWGLVEKLALLGGGPYETLFAFYFWTALLFLPFSAFMLWRYGSFRIDRRVWFWVFAAVITDLVALLSLRFALLDNLIGPVLTATATYPVVTAALSKKFIGEEITKTQFLGIGLTCVGVFILSV